MDVLRIEQPFQEVEARPLSASIFKDLEYQLAFSLMKACVISSHSVVLLFVLLFLDD